VRGANLNIELEDPKIKTLGVARKVLLFMGNPFDIRKFFRDSIMQAFNPLKTVASRKYLRDIFIGGRRNKWLRSLVGTGFGLV